MKNIPLAALVIFALSTGCLAACAETPNQSASDKQNKAPIAQSSNSQENTKSSSESTIGVSTSYSRAKMYDSVQELAKDSAAIVVGTIKSQEAGDDDDGWEPTVNITLAVDNALKGTIEQGTEIKIVQECTIDESPFKEGNNYLLYLKKSDTHYYVSGMTAGIYEQAFQQTRSAAATTSFTRVDKESGDDIPDEITEQEALGDSSSK